VELKKKFNESSEAMVNYVQVGHRADAVEYAIAGIKKIYESNLDQLGQDELTCAMEDTMRAWVEETLLQGAYLREYHLWEKACKAYFDEMARRNGGSFSFDRGKSCTESVREALSKFSVTMSSQDLSAIEEMRKRTNVMKHDAGLELDHFITRVNYDQAMAALGGFWECLAMSEKITA
jgi:hypothetical protein